MLGGWIEMTYSARSLGAAALVEEVGVLGGGDEGDGCGLAAVGGERDV